MLDHKGEGVGATLTTLYAMVGSWAAFDHFLVTASGILGLIWWIRLHAAGLKKDQK